MSVTRSRKLKLQFPRNVEENAKLFYLKQKKEKRKQIIKLQMSLQKVQILLMKVRQSALNLLLLHVDVLESRPVLRNFHTTKIKPKVGQLLDQHPHPNTLLSRIMIMLLVVLKKCVKTSKNHHQ